MKDSSLITKLVNDKILNGVVSLFVGHKEVIQLAKNLMDFQNTKIKEYGIHKKVELPNSI